MKFMLLVLSSFGFLLYLVSVLRIKFSSALFTYISTIVVLLYFFAIFGFLRAGAIFTVSVGLALFIYLAIKNYKRMPELKGKINWMASYNALYLVPFLVFYKSIPGDFLFTGWDEFSFWGLSAKLISRTDALYQHDSPIAAAFKVYPPAQQLFQYYWTFFSSWSEKNVLYSQIVFMLSALICISGAFFEKNSPLKILTFWVACGSLYFFGYDFSHLYADQLLALVFAANIALAAEARGIKGALIVSVCTALLILTKQIGLILALVVIAVYFLCSLTRRQKEGAASNLSSSCAYLSLCILSAAVSFGSWNWYLRKTDTAISYPIPALSSVFEQPMLGRLGKTVVAFIDRLHRQEFGTVSTAVFELPLKELVTKFHSLPISSFVDIISSRSIHFSVINAMAFLTAVSIICIILSKRGDVLSKASLFAMIAVGSIGYLAFLLLCYLIFFTEYEGTNLASFERYAGTYFLAWSLIVLSIYASAIARREKWFLKLLLVSPLLLCFLILPPKAYSDVRQMSVSPQLLEQRRRVDMLAEVVNKRIKKGEKAYFISQDSTGFEKYIFNYSMIPAASVWWCWSVGEKYRDGDIWTCNEKLATLLKGYAYLVIYHADKKFWDDNSSLFSEGSRGAESGIYSISEEGNSISLTKIH
ncbi:MULTISPECIES: hypothetical protein [Cupriavidus]